MAKVAGGASKKRGVIKSSLDKLRKKFIPTFGEQFGKAKKEGKKTFTWDGRSYTTEKKASKVTKTKASKATKTKDKFYGSGVSEASIDDIEATSSDKKLKPKYKILGIVKNK